MILTGPEIKRRLNSDIKIQPFNDNQLNPNSYNLRLHDELLEYTSFPLDMKKENPVKSHKITKDGFLLEPGKLFLGRTEEFTETYNLVPMLEGRSSIGRLGMLIHVTAGFGDVGFKGYWTLEITVIHPLIIYPLIEVCQIFYHTVAGDIIEYKSGKYQNNKGIQTSMIYKEFGKK